MGLHSYKITSVSRKLVKLILEEIITTADRFNNNWSILSFCEFRNSFSICYWRSSHSKSQKSEIIVLHMKT